MIWLLRVVMVLLLSAAAALAGRATAQERPSYARPLSPEEGRALRLKIQQLSAAVGLRDTVLIAVANRLRLSRANTDFFTLVRLLEQKAGEAAQLRKRLAELPAKLAVVHDTTLRTNAEASLERANLAFADGRFAEADDELAKLEILRQEESREAVDAWTEAVEARARIAELQLDFDRATQLRIDAADTERDRSELRQWRFLFNAAVSQWEAAAQLRDATHARRAVELFRERVLPLAVRQRHPHEWAQTQNSLGLALAKLSSFEDPEQRLREALNAFNQAAEFYRRDKEPKGWAMIQMNTAMAIGALGDVQNREEASDEAINLYRSAMEVYTRQGYQEEWSAIQMNVGIELSVTGFNRNDRARVDEGIAAFRLALSATSLEKTPSQWCSIQKNLSLTYYEIAARSSEDRSLLPAISGFRGCLQTLTRDHDALQWAETQVELGEALLLLAQRRQDWSHLDAATAAYRAALTVYTREDRPNDWALASGRLGFTLMLIGDKFSKCAAAREAATILANVQSSNARSYGTDWRAQVATDRLPEIARKICH